MNTPSAVKVKVWVRSEIGPEHVVTQAYDQAGHKVGAEEFVQFRRELVEIAKRYNVALDAFDFEDDSAAVIDSHPDPLM
ncbi:hypothetical protein [Streptacidiphilus sp. PAMC 29251]